MPSEQAALLADDTVATILQHGSLELAGRLVGASNASFLATASLDGVELTCVYKPVAGERPLWDFPDGNLAGREYASRLISQAGGFGVVPPTVLRDGRFGPGMCQRWVEAEAQHTLVDIVSEGFDAPGWLVVLEAEDQRGNPVLLVHADDDRLRDMAVFDVLINNADRKGGHILLECAPSPSTAEVGGADKHHHPEPEQLVWGCDHGISLHHEDKLRTVLWGWAGEPLRDRDRDSLARLVDALHGRLRIQLAEHLTSVELDALEARALILNAVDTMPVPGGGWPVIPWPPF
ncbi:MAG: SCO1664 family protein [Propionibacteriales bacterium]|nr:SCO1664 family protein [Propionibacteriales bacterium]